MDVRFRWQVMKDTELTSHAVIWLLFNQMIIFIIYWIIHLFI